MIKRNIKNKNKDPFGLNALSLLVSNHGILGSIQGAFGGYSGGGGGHGSHGSHGSHGGHGGHGSQGIPLADFECESVLFDWQWVKRSWWKCGEQR